MRTIRITVGSKWGNNTMRLTAFFNHQYGSLYSSHLAFAPDNDYARLRAHRESAMGSVQSLAGKSSYTKLMIKYQNQDPRELLHSMYAFLLQSLQQAQYCDYDKFIASITDNINRLNYDIRAQYISNRLYFHPLQVSIRYLNRRYCGLTAMRACASLLMIYTGEMQQNAATATAITGQDSCRVTLYAPLLYWAAVIDQDTFDRVVYQLPQLNPAIAALVVDDSNNNLEQQGDILYHQQLFVRAKQKYWDAVQYNQDNDILWSKIGYCWERMGNESDALHAYHTAHLLIKQNTFIMALYEIARGNNFNTATDNTYRADNLKSQDWIICRTGKLNKFAEKFNSLHPLVNMVHDMRDVFYETIFHNIALEYQKLPTPAPSLETFKHNISDHYIQHFVENHYAPLPEYLHNILWNTYRLNGAHGIHPDALNELHECMQTVADDEYFLPNELITVQSQQKFHNMLDKKFSFDMPSNNGLALNIKQFHTAQDSFECKLLSGATTTADKKHAAKQIADHLHATYIHTMNQYLIDPQCLNAHSKRASTAEAQETPHQRTRWAP